MKGIEEKLSIFKISLRGQGQLTWMEVILLGIENLENDR